MTRSSSILLGLAIAGLIALAIVAAVAHRPVYVTVYARDVSVCASVGQPFENDPG